MIIYFYGNMEYMDLEKYIFFILLRKGWGAWAKIGRFLTLEEYVCSRKE